MEAVVGHVAEIGITILSCGKANVGEAGLPNDAKIGLGVKFFAIGNVGLQGIPALDDLYKALSLSGETSSEEAGTFQQV